MTSSRHFTIPSLALALVLALLPLAKASAQNNVWMLDGTEHKGFPYLGKTTVPGGSFSGYDQDNVEVNNWVEGQHLAYKQVVVGRMWGSYPYVNDKGKMDTDAHNHQGEHSTCLITLPLPPGVITPGETVSLPVSSKVTTTCNWKPGRFTAVTGDLRLKVGNANGDIFKPYENGGGSINYSVKAPSGSPGQTFTISFIIGSPEMGASVGQSVTYRYKMVDASKMGSSGRGTTSTGGGNTGGGSTGGGDGEGVPTWVWVVGGVVVLVLLFRRKK